MTIEGDVEVEKGEKGSEFGGGVGRGTEGDLVALSFFLATRLRRLESHFMVDPRILFEEGLRGLSITHRLAGVLCRWTWCSASTCWSKRLPGICWGTAVFVSHGFSRWADYAC